MSLQWKHVAEKETSVSLYWNVWCRSVFAPLYLCCVSHVRCTRFITRYSKYVGCISIYWCKAKHLGHLVTVSDYFLFNQFHYYYKLLYLKLNIYISFWRYYWKFAVDVLSLLSTSHLLQYTLYKQQSSVYVLTPI